MKLKRILSLALIATMLLSMTITPAFAASTTANSTENVGTEDFTDHIDGTEAVEVNATVASTYSVTIPKTITMSGANKEANYTVSVSGDIADNESIVVNPDASFLMNTVKGDKDAVTATITQDKIAWKFNEFATQASGNISAPLTAGKWSGTFNFNVELWTDPLPPDTETMIYRAENLDPSITYTDFTIYESNRTNIGYTDETTDLVIPVAFKNGEKWYKVTRLYRAFKNCTNLTSVTIPDSVTSIKDSTFLSCTNLTSVTIPDSVTSIEDSTFSNCTSLTSVSIPDSVTSIGAYAFTSCDNLTSIEIPNSVTTIGDYAFQACSKLTEITIPDGVTKINQGTFYNCQSLPSITIPEGVTSIGKSAFNICKSLQSITIPDSVTSIGDSAFSNCTGLTSITIPDSVTSIGSKAFSSCTNLTSITFNGTQAQWNAITKGTYWKPPADNIHCTDGCLDKSENPIECSCTDHITE